MLSVNLAGFFHITQLAIAEMEKQGSGHIVQITTSLVDNAIASVPADGHLGLFYALAKKAISRRQMEEGKRWQFRSGRFR
jgi:short-subunit dehydrogenase